MDALYCWWTCRLRLRLIVSQLKAAGIHHRDPLFPLITEMALLPDRLFRLLVAEVLVLGVCTATILWLRLSDEVAVQVLAGSTAQSRILVLNAAGGQRWVSCLPGKVCLEVFLKQTKGVVQ